MTDLTNAERETHLNQTADDRGKWIVFSDDPVMIRKLDKIATATRITDTGKFYELDKAQVSIRKKRQLSAAQRRKLRENAQRLQNSSNNGSSETQNGR